MALTEREAVLVAEARALQPELVRLRREIHADPEIGLDLPRTQRRVLDALAGLDLTVVAGRASSSVVAVLTGAAPGPAVVLRADMDALPLAQAPGGETVSATQGVMHACGHDLHTAMLVGAARLLAARRDAIAGRVVFVFQPGEEGYDGMRVMLEDGLMDLIGPAALATYGLHTVAATVPHGIFTGKADASHASTATLAITVRGRGGHAGFPHAAVDPVPAAAELILALQVRLTRAVDVFDPAIITVGAIHGGTAANVIPDEVSLTGTARVFSPTQADRLPGLIREVCAGVATTYGVAIDVDYRPGYPVVMNDAEEVDRFRDVVTDLFGPSRYQPLAAPIPAGDDYARLMERIPGAFLLLGAGRPAADGVEYANHSGRAIFDDSLLADGVAALTAVTLRRLSGFPGEALSREVP